MKASGTLKFFAIVVALLAALCMIFPKEGITLGGMTLRFPTLHKMMVREKQKSMDELLVKTKKRDLTGVRDSVENCRRQLFEGQTRFWLPNDDIAFFDRFFALADNAKSEGRTVRILHYGDSQIEMDRISCRLRERLQGLFGGNGPGMIPFCQPIPTFSFSQSAVGSLICQSTWGDSTVTRANGNYGPMLRSWRVDGGATLSIKASKGRYAPERTGRFGSIRVLFNNRPGPLNVSMRDRAGGGTYSEKVVGEGIHMVSWRLDSLSNSAHLTVNGSADIYGVLVDGFGGVAVDNISMRGVSGHQFKMANFEQLAKAYSMMDVGIIIMQFGGNSVPYLNGDKSIDTYCAKLGEQIDYIRKACPNAAILFVGPSDMSTKVGGELATYPKLPTVVERLRTMANEHGAAFWSIYDAMGGRNSMISWVKNGYAGPDYIHFSHKGAEIMGDYLTEALLNMYELYRLRHQLTPEEFEEIW